MAPNATMRLRSANNMHALRLADVSKKVGLCPSYIYRLMSQGQFVKPAKWGRVSLWNEAEVDSWLAARFAERDAQAVTQ